ncbi:MULTISPECIES: DoxX family protein [Kitasatospora]|uniref:Membrane protein n=2 Tax=Kitasatospora TaxID=2063 RepID=A0ABT1J667_9ACTN|nr:DoxX family protein [Kitasatospora paracochleata]MCP2312629.1 putative membrane protein [Kitasatospora paracochleata]
MNIALWITAGLLAALYLAAGLTKAGRPREQLLTDPRMGWAADYTDGGVRAIGLVEILGALGLVLPQATGIAQVLTPLAAAGLAVVQLAAARLHLKRGETSSLPMNAVLFLLAALVAVGRIGG